MVKRGSFCASCCLLVMISVGVALGQDQEIDVRAKRYYTLLSKRPGSAQLFDRFYDAWLDSSTLESLGIYRAAAERDPENGEVLYLKAQAELRTLDFDGAIADLEKARTAYDWLASLRGDT